MKSTKDKIAEALKSDATKQFSVIARELGVSRQRVHQVATELGFPVRQIARVDDFPAEYNSWQSMIQRCTNPKNANWKRYGGRGIRVCDRWRRSFQSFLNDMGPKPSPKHSLDRINCDGPYDPMNCRWATAQKQARNKSATYEMIESLVQNGFTLDEIEAEFEIEIPDHIRETYKA